jgi:NRPS condensation-like uncharacterized protein
MKRIQTIKNQLPEKSQNHLFSGDRRHRRWYRLDNAAKIYPVIMRSRHGAAFRISVVLREEIDPAILRRALEKVLARLPFFAVRLRSGLFWYYLETCDCMPPVEPDVQNPLRGWTRKEARSHLFRVRHGCRRIGVEFFHGLTDGYGGLVFVKTLAAAYLQEKGIASQPGHGVLDLSAQATDEEMEDAYKLHSNFRVVYRPRQSKAFHLQGTIAPGHHLKIITGIIPVDKASVVAHKFGISITELLVGIYLYELYVIQQQGGYNALAPVRVSVPINVRRFYPSKTLRNFALYTNPGIEPAYGTYTLEEIFGLVHHFIRYTVGEKYLNAMMSANVGPEKSMLMRLAPLMAKNIAMRLVYKYVGDSRFTSTLSNLGDADLPPDLADHIDRFEFMLGPSHFTPVNCAVVSTANQMVITFSSTMSETDPQRAFFKQLVKLGIPVRIESNIVYGE